MDERKALAERLSDPELRRYFYLDEDVVPLAKRLDSIPLELVESQDEVPFNAQVKSYLAARDDQGDPWIVKPVASDEEMRFHRSCMVAYLLDHATGTLAAPTTAVNIKGKRFRATKVVKRSVQISSYNYLESPFIGILRADLVNRWIFFDEDRNPNNYLVITNSKNLPFVVAIDYDKADLFSDQMKITGQEDKFGWHRTEKTRFLTLLRPEHFSNLAIEEFDARLKAFKSVSDETLLEVARIAFSFCSKNAEAEAASLVSNIKQRREYVDSYFRKMFKPASQLESASNNDEYAAFGKSFLDMHNKKK